MSTSVVPRLLLDDISAGDELPALNYTVTATTVVLGALATRDWRPMHHDKDFAVERNGTQDIFLNTPNQAAWFERYLTDWTGPYGRLARVTFRMKGSVFPGDTMVAVRGGGVDVGGRSRLRLRHGGRDAGGRRRRQDHLCRPGGGAHQCRRQPLGPQGRPVAAGAMTVGRCRSRVRVRTPSSRREILMLDLDFDQEQELLRQTARDLLARHCSLDVVRQMEDDPVGYPAALWTQLGELDLIGLLLPEEYGGSGMSLIEGVALYEELGRALAPTPHFVCAVLSGGVLAEAGSEAQKDAVAAAGGVGRGHRDPGLAGARERVLASGRADAGPSRRRRVPPERPQAPRALRLVGGPAGGAGPDR